ncbi:hypothetical protein chiPu_0008932 [Chiloscyllium punctatum]|uniref:Uncharacterized protein n=1 Tax=Chiloscyllium punctatum TaxID=137246 RepID=A0A401SJB5_CHIPU|nr:hypothetical protein [Chiloscyllium punctatum]
MTKIWMVYFGALALAVLLQIKADNTSTTKSTTDVAALNSTNSTSGVESTLGNISPSQSPANSTGPPANLHCPSSLLLPLTIGASIAYLCC